MKELIVSSNDSTGIDTSVFSEQQRAVAERTRLQAAQASEPMDVRAIGRDTQAALCAERARLLESFSVLEAGQAGDLLNEVVSTSKEITAKIKPPSILAPFVRAVDRKSGKYQAITKRLDTLVISVDTTVQQLRDSLTLLDKTLASVAQTADALAPIIVGLDLAVQEDKRVLETCDKGTPEYLNTEYLATEKMFRLRDLQTQYTLSRQQLVRCMLTRKATASWINELSYAAQQVVPIFQTAVLEELGIRAANQAAKVYKGLKTTINQAVLQSARTLKDNVAILSDAHETSILDAKTVAEAQTLLEDTINTVLEGRKQSLSSFDDTIQHLRKLDGDIAKEVDRLGGISDTQQTGWENGTDAD